MQYLDEYDDYWKYVPWTDELKIEPFGHKQNHPVWHPKDTAFKEQNILVTVKHGGGSIMIWVVWQPQGRTGLLLLAIILLLTG